MISPAAYLSSPQLFLAIPSEGLHLRAWPLDSLRLWHLAPSPPHPPPLLTGWGPVGELEDTCLAAARVPEAPSGRGPRAARSLVRHDQAPGPWGVRGEAEEGTGGRGRLFDPKGGQPRRESKRERKYSGKTSHLNGQGP